MSYQFDSKQNKNQNHTSSGFKSFRKEDSEKNKHQQNFADLQPSQFSRPGSPGDSDQTVQPTGFKHNFSHVPVQLDSSAVIQPRASGERLEKRTKTSGGQTAALPNTLQQGLEKLSGVDLSDVRVHYNSNKPSRLNALAYTQGKDVFVGPGQEKHLPHEGWHVVQQMQGRVQPTTKLGGVAINDEDKLEREADEMGKRATQKTGKRSQLPKRDVEPNRPGDSVQQKSIFSNITNRQGMTVGSLKREQGVSFSNPAQLQAEDETEMREEQPGGENDEAKRAEYEALKPRTGSESGNQSATTPGSTNTKQDEDLSQLKSSSVVQRAGCSPANTGLSTNALASAERTRESWRSHVTFRARVDNQNDHLTVGMYVFAKVYYGLWLSWEHLDFSATVDLTCQSVDDKCEIAVNERGGSVWNLTHSPASGAIAIQTDSRAGGTQKGLTVRVGGAVGASSGVSAGVGSASAGVSFPDASIDQKISMGTFIYTCRE